LFGYETRSCRNNDRTHFFLRCNLFYQVCDRIALSHNTQCLAAMRVVGDELAVLPKTDNSIQQLLLTRFRMHDIIGLDAIAAGCPSDIVDVRIADRGQDLGSLFVQHWKMDQPQVDFTHLSPNPDAACG